MKSSLLACLFIVLCFSSKSQEKDDETLTISDPLLIVISGTPVKSVLSINRKISYSYLGDFAVTNYYDLNTNPFKYSSYKHILIVSVTRVNSSEGKYKGEYTLHDTANETEVVWSFFSNDDLPYLTPLLKTLYAAASDPNLGYQDVFPDDQRFTSKKPKEIVFNTTDYKLESIDESLKATFMITSETGQGSGFFIDSEHAITNDHVVGSGKELIGTNYQGKEFEIEVIRRDPENDLALLKTKEVYNSSFYFDLTSSLDSNIVGKEVFAIGSPASDELINTVSGGIISGVRTFDKVEVIQINAPVNLGNSGGPLIDADGNLYGVIVAKIAGLATEGIAFAIPKQQLIESFNLTPQ